MISDPKSLLAEIEKNSSDTRQLAALLQVLLMVPYHDPDAAYVGERKNEDEERRWNRQRGRGRAIERERQRR